MAYERSWQFLAPQGPRVAASVADAPAYFMWMLKSFLKGEVGGAVSGLWTCYGSCDGATAGLDANDRWGSPYNIALIPVTDSASGTHAWIVLTRDIVVNGVTHSVRLLLSGHGQGTLNSGHVWVGLTTGTPTGGTTTADPTMTNPMFQRTTYNTVTYYATNTTSGRKYYGALSTTGDFWFAETINGEISRGIYFANPVGCKLNDQYPFHTIYSELLNISGTSLRDFFTFGGGTLYTRVAASGQGATPGLYYNGSTGYPALVRPALGTDSVPFLDGSDVSLFDLPAYVVVGNNTSTSSTAGHARGRLPDVGICGGADSNATSSATYRPCNIGTAIRDSSGNIEYVTMNQLILPYNALVS